MIGERQFSPAPLYPRPPGRQSAKGNRYKLQSHGIAFVPLKVPSSWRNLAMSLAAGFASYGL